MNFDLDYHQERITKFFFFSNNLAEEIIAKKIEGIQKMIKVHDNPDEEEVGIPINPAIKRHFELKIKTLREAPRDADKLKRIFKTKQRELEDAVKIEDTERLVPEIEMLRFVPCAVSVNYNNGSVGSSAGLGLKS